MAEIEKKPIKITETVLRDAHQSLIATRMTTEQMLPIVEKMDQVGYHSIPSFPEGRSLGPVAEIPGRLQEHQAADALPWAEYPGIPALR